MTHLAFSNFEKCAGAQAQAAQEVRLQGSSIAGSGSNFAGIGSGRVVCCVNFKVNI